MDTKTETKTESQFPLFLNYRFPVSGKGFWVGITLRGRLLLEEEVGGDVWIYGVNPGGISVFAQSREAALTAFTARLHEVMNGVAESVETFDAFKKEVEESFATNGEYETMWKAALQCVREGKTDIAGMTREDGDFKPEIRVEKIANPTPANNVDQKVTMAAPCFAKAA